MASKVLLKKSSVASRVPLVTDLDYGELALNYADGILYYKKAGGTTIGSITTSSSGTGVNATRTTQVFTATSGQTAFTFTYTVGLLDVYLNGTKLIITDDFTATDGATFTLSTGATTGDIIEAVTTPIISTATVATLTDTQTLTNKTFTGFTETVYAVSGTTPALSPANGTIQTWTLSGNSTPTAGTWTAGQAITLMVVAGASNTITWTSLPVTWVGSSAPTLSTTLTTVIELWKVGTVIYGALVGNA